jgi:hypothetical protein
MDAQPEDIATDWRRQRRQGLWAIAASAFVAAAIWLAIRHLAPPVAQMETIADRLIFAFNCWCFAVFFCLAMGIEAVAHERLQSPAFDPLTGYETRRLRVNQRYLQNTLEQLVLFTAALFGLAIYSDGGEGMRAVEATAFLGAPGLMLSLIVLIYVIIRISLDLGGLFAAAGVVGLFLAIEAVLFRTTRSRAEGRSGGGD